MCWLIHKYFMSLQINQIKYQLIWFKLRRKWTLRTFTIMNMHSTEGECFRKTVNSFFKINGKIFCRICHKLTLLFSQYDFFVIISMQNNHQLLKERTSERIKPAKNLYRMTLFHHTWDFLDVLWWAFMAIWLITVILPRDVALNTSLQWLN